MLTTTPLAVGALFASRAGPKVQCVGHTTGDRDLQAGLYKVQFHTVHGTGSGVIYVIDGKLRGGNSAFAFVGSYSGQGDSIQVRIATERHNDDPQFKPLFGTDRITLTLRGKDEGHIIDFEGTALQLPGVAFKATMTRICD
jgi:hypothetical protein